jgi:hypothetical protein
VACTDADMSVAGQIASSYISRDRTHELGAPLDALMASLRLVGGEAYDPIANQLLVVVFARR